MAWQDLDERAELLDRGDRAFVGRSHFDLGRHHLDVVDRLVDLLTDDSRDGAHAAVFDRDLALVGLLHRSDVLAPGANDEADLVRRNLHRLEARCVRAELLARRAQGLQHFPEDVQAAFLRLLEGFGEDLGSEAFALDVHLQRRDATTGTDDLEVHVAAPVFAAEDVGQDRVLLAFHYEAHRDAGNRLLDRHTGIHHRERARASGCHRRRAVRLHDLAVDADRIGEVLLRRQQRLETTLGQGTVTNLTATGSEHALGLTNGERRERVVQQEALARLRHQAIDDLLVIDTAERDNTERLRLTASEQHRTVHAWQHANFDRDRADRLRIAAIGARTTQDRLTLAEFDDATGNLADLLVPSLGLCFVRTTRRGERFLYGILGSLDRLTANGLRAECRRRLAQFLAARLLDLGDELGVDDRSIELHLRLASHLGQLVDHLNDDLDDLVRLAECFENDALLHFLGAGFDHHDGVRVATHREVELVLFALQLGPQRVDDDLVIDVTHAHAAERTAVRQRADRQSGKACDRGNDVAVVLTIGCNDLRQHLHVAAEAIGEHRPDRTVDDATGQDLLRRRATFALEEATGDDTDGGRLLAVVDRQGEEVHVVRGGRAIGRSEHNRVAVARQNGTIGQLGHAAGFEGQRATADLAFDDERAGAINCTGALRRLLARRLGGCFLRGLGRSFLRLLGGRLGGGTAGLLRRACAIGALLGCHRVSSLSSY